MTHKFLAAAAALLVAVSAAAQHGENSGMGGPDDRYASLYKWVTGHEKKMGSFNLYLNTGGGLGIDGNGGRFRMDNLRLEMKGDLSRHLSYRMRYHLNKSSVGMDEDNLPPALDILILGWKLNEHYLVQFGKIFQAWGGFEYDENPVFVYKYSDLNNATDCFTSGAAFSWFPNPRNELQVSVTNTQTVPLSERYPASAGLREARLPLAYILNWNGTLLGGLVSTRWGAGRMVFAEDEYLDRITLGTRLNLPHLTWYVDLIGEYDTVDYSAIGYNELGTLERDTSYLTMVTKADWRFARKWNLAAQLALEGASCAAMANYRKKQGALCSLEFYPEPSQDFRVFLAGFLDRCSYSAETGLSPWTTSSVKLGFIYRIKAF